MCVHETGQNDLALKIAKLGIQELHDEPEPKDNEGWNLNDLEKHKDRHQRKNTCKRIRDDISAEYAGDRATRSDAWDCRLGIQDRVRDPGAEAAEQVKYKVREVTQPVLDVVSKNPEVPHIADQMEPTAMQEHRSEEGYHHRGKCEIGSGPRDDCSRNDSIIC